MFLIFHLLWES